MIRRESIGVALPATSAEGAWRFADDVARRADSGGPCLDRTVYTYPTKWIKPGEGPGGGKQPRRPGDGSGEKGSSLMRDGGRLIEPLEHVLSRRMPAWKRALDIAGSLAALILLGGALGDRYGRRTALLLFITIAATGYLVVAAASSWPVVLAGMALVMTWSSMASPALFAIVGDALPSDRRALGFSVQRPRRKLAKADPAEQDRWQRYTYPRLKKNR